MRVRIWETVTVCTLALLLISCSFRNSSNSSHANTITNRGSDTLVNLALAWAEQYSNENPDIAISVSGGGSGTGITALINGSVNIANASRLMTPDEIAQAEANGIHPFLTIVARDAIAVVDNPSNPIDHLTLQQLSDLFAGRVNNWRDLGGENRPVIRVSRETNSGTHVYFLETVIRLGDAKDPTIFAADTLLLPSSEGITAEVGQNPNAIGYDGLGYITDSVKKIAVAPDSSGPYVLPSVETVLDKSYPISRDLYMYTDGPPAGIVKIYMDWILGPEGQKIVATLGFIPV